MAAHVLVNRGLNVLLLEIGPKWNRTEIFHTEHSWPYEMPFRGLGSPGQYDGLWKVSAYTEHLYLHPRKALSSTGSIRLTMSGICLSSTAHPSSRARKKIVHCRLPLSRGGPAISLRKSSSGVIFRLFPSFQDN